MKRWLADYRVESELKLEAKEPKLVYVHPEKLFEIHISNAQSDEKPKEALAFQVIVTADQIQTAEKETQEHLQKFLHLMSFITQTGYKISRKICLIDWSNDALMRDAYVYTAAPPSQPEEALSSDLLNTANLLQSSKKGPALDMALRWFAAGVRSTLMEDQFQFFWFVIELIATSTKGTNKVSDKCPKCRGDLYCSACKETPTHRPYDKQAIEALLIALELPNNLVQDLQFIRNKLMHGEERASIEKTIKEKASNFSFDRAVDLIGRAAWRAILGEFQIPENISKDQKQAFLQATTFVDWSLAAKAHIQTPIAGELKIENLRLPRISLETK